MMEISSASKVVLNFVTFLAWLIGIAISFAAVAKGKKLNALSGVCYKKYLLLVGATEAIYIIGAAMILSAMGINVINHLAEMELWKFYQIVSSFDVSTIEIVGLLGWLGFFINRAISFVSPGYLLIRGGKRLPKYFFYSACTEVCLEVVTTILIFVTLRVG